MGDIVLREDLKTKLGIAASDASQDAALDQAIAQSEGEFQGPSGIGQFLIARAYTERREGNGRTWLALFYYPLVSVTSVVLEGEVAVNHEDPNTLRFQSGDVGIRPRLVFVNNRIFSPPRWPKLLNLTISYQAGYANQVALKAALPDVWSMVLEHAAMGHQANKSAQRQVAGQAASQSYMGQGISYLPPIAEQRFEVSPAFARDWERFLIRHRRLPISMVAGGRI